MNPHSLTYSQTALKRNGFFEASKFFRLQAAHYPDIVTGWLGLFQSSDQPSERIECLDQLLRITRAESQVAEAGKARAIKAAPTSKFELFQSPTQTAPIQSKSYQGRSEGQYEYDAITAVDAEIESGWPALQTQIVQWTVELVVAGNRLMEMIDTELVPALTALKQRIKSHSVFTTQFSTGDGHKLRSMPGQRSQKLPRVLSWVGWLIGVLLLGLVAAVVMPVVLGNRAYVIVSGSMVPTFATGSVVVVRPVESNQLQVGDVIAYSPQSGAIPIVHRIISIRTEAGIRYFTTQGDANATADPNEAVLPTATWQLWYSLPWLGYLINFTFSKMGAVLFILVPLVGLGVLTLKDKLRPPAKRRLLRANS